MLCSEVAKIAATLSGPVGASVAVIGEDPIPLINGDDRIPFMSMVKTLVAIQTLKQVEEGKLSLDQQITVSLTKHRLRGCQSVFGSRKLLPIYAVIML